MSESIMSNKKECYICGTTGGLHKHHIFYGTANRKLSEKYGCWVWLCPYHHNMSDAGVHFNKLVDKMLKAKCQEEWEKKYGKGFRETFGKNYR